MKKTIKRLLASFMVAVMVLTAAPLSGFVGIKLPELPQFSKLTTFFNDVSDFFLTALAQAKSIQYFDYTIMAYESADNVQVTITKCDTSASGEVVIPAFIEGYPVKRIGAEAFKNCNSITSLIIPDNVELSVMGTSAFQNCSNLKSVIFGDNSRRIGESAFKNCLNLESITIGKNMNSISSDAFDGCANLSAVNFNAISCSAGSFVSCQNINEFTLGESVSFIGGFSGCTWIKNVDIPKSVTSIGREAFKDCINLDSVVFDDCAATISYGAFENCANIKYLDLGDNLVSIEAQAFKNCTSLTSLKIPDSTQQIAKESFYGCSSLETLSVPYIDQHIGWLFGNNYYTNSSIPGFVYVQHPCLIWKYRLPLSLKHVDVTSTKTIGNGDFGNCYMIKEIELSDSIKTIGKLAFEGCKGLESIKMGRGVTSIGEGAFKYLTDIENFYYAGDLESWSEISFFDQLSHPTNRANNVYFQNKLVTDIKIPNTFTEIDDFLFYGFRNLKQVFIPDSVTSIGERAFADCKDLICVEIPKSVTSIGEAAFTGCSSLESISLPFVGSSRTPSTANDEKERFFGYIFGYSKSYIYNNSDWNLYSYIPSGLRSVNITDTENILAQAFKNCTSLVSVTLGGNVTSIGESAFYSCTALTNIIIPDSVTSIGAGAFNNCKSITSLTIPNSVTSIGNYVFSGCSGLLSITIPDSVTSIGNRAFNGCSGLTSVTIPNSVTSIGDYAFSGCTGINSVRIPGSVTKLGSYLFSGCTRLYSVTLCTGVENASSAFSGCTSIDTFTISSTVKSFSPGGSNPTYIYYGGSEQEWKEAKFSLPKNENRVIYYNSDIPPSSDRISFSKDVYPCFVGESFYISGELVSTKQVGDITLTWTSGDGVELHTPASVINSSRYKASFSVEAKGVEPGYYTVTVKGSNGKSDSCTVRVVEPKSELTVSMTNAVEGGYYCINNTLVDHNLNELDSVSYKITVENKLSIDSTGVPLTEEIKEQLTIENISISAGLSDYSSLAIDIADITELKSIGTLAPGEKKVYTLNIYPLKLENKKISAELNMTATATGKDDIVKNEPIVIKNKLYTPKAIVSFYVDSEVTYNDKKYSKDSLPVTLRITNRIPSDFKGDISKIKDLPEYQIKLTGASVSVLESDLIKKSDISHTITNDTLKPGQSLTLEGTITINTKHKISELIEEEYVGIEYEVQTSANNLSDNKVVTFINKDFKDSSDELSKKAQEELEKLKKRNHAQVTFFDLNIDDYLNKEEREQLGDLLLMQIVLQTLPQDSLVDAVKDQIRSGVSDDTLNAIENVDAEVAKYLNVLKSAQTITPSITKEAVNTEITLQTSKGPVTVYFDGTFDKLDYNDRNFANTSNTMKYRIEGDHIPNGAVGTTGNANILLVNIDNFSKAVEDVAADAIIDACTEAYGPAINKAQDVLFGRAAENIVNKTTKIAWVIATSPSKVVSADCPVDIFVYDENGNLCASVESDVVTRSCEKAAFEISASKKSVRLFDEGYTVKFIPTGNATMNVTVEEYANSFSVLKTYEFTDVPISYGGVYTQSVNTEYMSKDNSYELTLEDGTVVEPDTVIDNFHYHTVEKYETVTEATCSSAEVVCGECTVCQNLVYDTIGEPVDCTPGEWVVVKEATCAQIGEKQIKCVYCDDVLETEEISLLPHTEGEWIITVQPTQTLEGKKEQKCTVCGKTLKQESVDKLPSGKVRSVSIENFTMEYKDSATITPNIEVDAGVGYTVSYNSSDSSVIQIDENGNITTRDKGSATITVTVTDEHGNTVTDTCEVTVKYKWWQWIIVIVLFGWIWY